MLKILKALEIDKIFLRLKKYIFSTLWMLSEHTLRLFSAFFIGLWVARFLGVESFGIYSYVLAITAILSSVAKFGLDAVIVDFISRKKFETSAILVAGFWLRFLCSILILCIQYITIVFSGFEDHVTKYIFLISIAIVFYSFGVFEMYFEGVAKGKTIALCKILQLLLSAILKVSLILNDSDLFYFILVSAFDIIFLNLAYFISYRFQNKNPLFSKFDYSIAKNLLNSAWPLILSSLFIMIYTRIDQIMLKYFLGFNEVGIYSAAVKISELLYFWPVILTIGFFPAISRYKDISVKIYHQRLQLLYTFLIWSSLFIAVFWVILSEKLILFLYGVEYSNASSILQIHVWGLVFVSMGVISNRWLVSESMTTRSLYRTLLGAIMNIILNIFLIPSYGINGAAIATLISQIFTTFLYDIFDPKMHFSLKQKIKAFRFAIK